MDNTTRAFTLPGFGALNRPDQEQAYRGAKMGWGNFFAKLEQVLAQEA